MRRLWSFGLAVITTTSAVTVVLLVTGWGSAAAAQVSSVFVNNTASNPVPVQATGTVPIHEQGTANVDVTNSQLATSTAAASKHDVELLLCDGNAHAMASGGIAASVISIINRGTSPVEVDLGEGGAFPNTRFDLIVGAGEDQVVPLTQPVDISTYVAGGGSGSCDAELLVSGT